VAPVFMPISIETQTKMVTFPSSVLGMVEYLIQPFVSSQHPSSMQFPESNSFRANAG
jgi:hypothetical protein